VIGCWCLGFGYRTSLLKRSMRPAVGTDSAWFPTPRYVVLEVVLTMPEGRASAPVAYAELARRLGVRVGDRATAAAVRETVLELRAAKGMLVDGCKTREG
jgi:UDP-N-acetylmuramate dehydrogenase